MNRLLWTVDLQHASSSQCHPHGLHESTNHRPMDGPHTSICTPMPIPDTRTSVDIGDGWTPLSMNMTLKYTKLSCGITATPPLDRNRRASHQLLWLGSNGFAAGSQGGSYRRTVRNRGTTTDAGAAVNRIDINSWTPLMRQFERDIRMLCRLYRSLLLSVCVNVDTTDNEDLMARDQVAGLTPLMYAAAQGHAYIVEDPLPLSLPREVDAVEIKSNGGCTALYLAASKQHKVCKSLPVAASRSRPTLIGERSFRRRSKSHRGYTALSTAALRGHIEVVHLLLSQGASVEAQSCIGDTPLLLAATRGRLEVVRALLVNGASPNIKNVMGETPLSRAVAGGYVEVAARYYELLQAPKSRSSHLSSANGGGQLGLPAALVSSSLPLSARRSDDEAEIEDNGKSPCQDLREALGLLAAVAHVDNAAYKKLLVENGKLEVGNQEEQFEGEFMPRFQLALIDDRVDSDRDLLKGVMEFCGTGQYSTQSAEYKRTLLKIAALNGKMSCTGSTEIEVPVTVQLGPWLTPSSQEMIAYLRKVQETIRTIRTQWQQYYDREHPRLSVVFVLESIMVDLRDISISAELAELIKRVLRAMAAREAVGKLMFGLFGGTKKAAALESGGFDFEATSITGPLAAEYGHGNQLALCSLHFDCEGMQDWVFERMSSAVVVSQTTQHLSLRLELNDGDDGDDGDCRWRWQWIIFACFSEKARLHSRLESLTLRNAVITNEAVESMAAVLAADAPEEGLLGYPSHSNGAPIDICIKAESTIELLSMTPNDVPNTMHSFKLEREISGVRLLGEVDESGWVNALIPGFGRCQVQRKSLIYRELKLRPNGLAGVTSLTIEFGEDPDPEALLGLLLLVGASLTHLTLEFESFNTRSWKAS
ncbi:Ankyrin repeat-containing domain [Phytophthora cactorum]|nr:Ankyrin repeat-containing domain [Phytophthora cactorum]